MKLRAVELAEDAKNDMIAFYDWIAKATSPATALSYIERIETYIQGFEVASECGHLREDIRPGLRIVGFENRVTIAFVVEDERVVILRLFYAGQNWAELMQ
ncbi:MAG: type II toxin-antitoxin system RelE/ParE family toxin [Hyphomicrobiales bacterium]|nr:type II toxin-antitoxin system RelE/ParE family toxin [Hyphomicrobiales bacterium]